MDRRPEPVLTGGLSRVAGLMPPMLLSKGASKAVLGAGTAAASKTGAKLTLKAVPALAAMPLFTLLMIAATFAYAIRGQLALTGDGVQRTDEAEAASAIRAWWVRNIVPTLIMSLLLFTALAFDPSGFSEDGVVLRFVLPRGKNEATCSDELSDAHEKCEENGMKPTWITSDDALDLTPVKTVWNGVQLCRRPCN